MSSAPRISVDLARIEANTRVVVERCARQGIHVFGVTKGTCGMPQVARAMLRGGVRGLAESRFENIRRLRAAGLDCPVMLLRAPPRGNLEELVASVDVSLESELSVLREISRVAERMCKVHEVILMVDLGDLREGIWPDELLPTAREIVALPGVRIVGVGTNLNCFGGVVPSPENMRALAEHARQLHDSFGLEMRYVSGGNSGSLPLLLDGGMPEGINQLRIGEAILQGGRDTFFDQPWEALDRGAFELSGEVLELKVKPSVPIGRTGVDAFGRKPVFEDRGARLRGILNIGREDVVAEALIPVAEGVSVLGASSDHLLVDLSDVQPPPQVGDRISFRMGYGALLAAMTSEYVEKRPMHESAHPSPAKAARLIVAGGATAAALSERYRVPERLRDIGFDVDADARADVADAAEAAARAGRTPLVLAEERPAIGPALQGLARAHDAYGLLWFSANAALMPGDALHDALGFGDAARQARPQLAPENVVMIGLRDVHPDEAARIHAARIGVFTIADIDALGIREVMRQALAQARAGTGGVVVAYEPNATDIPGYADGAGGMTIRETHQAMELVAAAHALRAMAVAGLGEDASPRVVADTFTFVLSCFGKQIITAPERDLRLQQSPPNPSSTNPTTP